MRRLNFNLVLLPVYFRRSNRNSRKRGCVILADEEGFNDTPRASYGSAFSLYLNFESRTYDAGHVV